MAYLGINNARYKFLLRFGTDDDELRRFFSDKRLLLIHKGARVQNLPRGPEARVTSMLSLPTGTDHIVQQWFSTNLTMIDPEPVEELVDTFRLYEDEDEQLPQGDAKKLSRACLIHLFSDDPSPKLVEYLKSPLGGNELEANHEPELDQETVPQQSPTTTELSFVDPALARALVALLEGKDPDEYLSGLQPDIASLIAGLYAIKKGYSDEVRSALDDLSKLEQVKSILHEYEARLAKIKESSKPAATGIQLFRFEEAENPEFDFAKDQIIGKCTNDFSETAVFIQPFAMRTSNGKLLSLESQTTREVLFPNSGDIQAFSGRPHPRQPSRGELGIWHIAPNDTHGIATHRTNFHLTTAKADVYEVRQVPFASTDYDSVREYIKEQITESSKKQLDPILFQLRDDLIVGCVPGKDLTRDDGFDDGLHCWKTLNAFRFEGRVLVPGPLPSHDQYECATLASTLKKFFYSKNEGPERLTKAQLKHMMDRVNSGEANLNTARHARLLEELKYIEDDASAFGILLEEAMKDEKIAARIEKSIQDKVDEQAGRKIELINELKKLEMQRDGLRKSITKQEREQRALPLSITKAIKDSIEKAKEDAFETLGQVVVFKALMEELGGPHNPVHAIANDLSASIFRIADHDASPFLDVLKSLGLSPKHAKALEVTAEAAFNAGMILVIEGIAARLAAEAWGRKDETGCIIMDCAIGLTVDGQMSGIAIGETRSVVILDANVSPPDIYARSLIDRVQRRIISSEQPRLPRIIMSLSTGVASLPLPNNVEAMAVCISLDHKPEFLPEDDVTAILEDMQDASARKNWASRLWGPAFNALLQYLKAMPSGDVALVLSVLEVKSS